MLICINSGEISFFAGSFAGSSKSAKKRAKQKEKLQDGNRSASSVDLLASEHPNLSQSTSAPDLQVFLSPSLVTSKTFLSTFTAADLSWPCRHRHQNLIFT